MDGLFVSSAFSEMNDHSAGIVPAVLAPTNGYDDLRSSHSHRYLSIQ
jgi:hypothetical protein